MNQKLKALLINQYNVYIILALKIIFYYLLIDWLPIRGAIGILSFVYMVMIFYCFSIRKGKYTTLIFTIAYTLITFLMFADAIYFQYFNQLTSINQIWQMSNLLVVNDGVKFAMPPVSVLLFADIPLVVYYFSLAKRHREENLSVTNGLRPSVVVLTVIATFILITNPIKADAVTRINNTEFFSYHIVDLFKNTIVRFFDKAKPLDEILTNLDNNEVTIKSEKYKGVGKDMNLILIQIESFQNFVLNRTYNGQELTPNLNKLLQENTIYFENYYQNIGKGNTADAEFATQNSLYPVILGESYRLYADNTFKGLPWMFREKGYQAIAIHGYKGDFWNREYAYVNQGFQDFISEEDLEITEAVGFGLTDKEMFKQAIPHIQSLREPYYTFIITLTNHFPYLMPEELVTLALKEEDQETIFGQYLQSVRYTDEAIGEFIQALVDEGLYENTVIAMYGDHHGLNPNDDAIYTQMTEYLGYSYDFDEMLNIPLIIHIPNSGIHETITTVGGQVDFMPTIANIMDLKIEHPFVFGKDIINDKEGFIASVTYMFEGSFINNNIILEYSRDGVFENSRAWDLRTREAVEVETFKEDANRAAELLNESRYVLDNDAIYHYFNLQNNKQ